MSLVKQHLWQEQHAPTAEDIEEYELYCYYLDMVERYNTTAPMEFLEEVFSEEVEWYGGQKRLW